MATGEKRVKISANLPQADLDMLRWLAAQYSTTMTEALRRAIATEKFVRDIYADGGRLLIMDKGSDTVREVILR